MIIEVCFWSKGTSNVYAEDINHYHTFDNYTCQITATTDSVVSIGFMIFIGITDTELIFTEKTTWIVTHLQCTHYNFALYLATLQNLPERTDTEVSYNVFDCAFKLVRCVFLGWWLSCQQKSIQMSNHYWNWCLIHVCIPMDCIIIRDILFCPGALS